MPSLVDRYRPICDAIATLLRPNAEVVLHDLASQRIAYIANGFSKRKLTDESLIDPEVSLTAPDRVIGPYAKTNWDGRRLKSITAILPGSRGRAVGLICINYDIDAIDTAVSQLAQFIAISGDVAAAEPLIAKDWREAVNALVGGFLKERNVTIRGLTYEDRDALIDLLDTASLFDVRKAVLHVADLLELSRATIYSRLAAIRARRVNEPMPSKRRSRK